MFKFKMQRAQLKGCFRPVNRYATVFVYILYDSSDFTTTLLPYYVLLIIYCITLGTQAHFMMHTSHF